MKQVLVSILIYFLTIYQASSQRLNLTDVVNSACETDCKEVDTLYYAIGECHPFFDSSSTDSSSKLKIIFFQNERELIKRLPKRNAHKFILKMHMSDISTTSIKMKISICKTNAEMLTHKEGFLIYHSEKTISCKLTKEKKWVYDKTLKVNNQVTSEK